MMLKFHKLYTNTIERNFYYLEPVTLTNHHAFH